jgi:hypothetical protein
MTINIHTLDNHIAFLRREIQRLDSFDADWAEKNAATMQEIIQILIDLRRQQSMTTMSGKMIK